MKKWLGTAGTSAANGRQGWAPETLRLVLELCNYLKGLFSAPWNSTMKKSLLLVELASSRAYREKSSCEHPEKPVQFSKTQVHLNSGKFHHWLCSSLMHGNGFNCSPKLLVSTIFPKMKSTLFLLNRKNGNGTKGHSKQCLFINKISIVINELG